MAEQLYKGALGSADDLDDRRMEGCYSTRSSINQPSERAVWNGYLRVLLIGRDAYMQIWTTNTNFYDCYIRQYKDGKWSDWVKVTTTTI